ncbi:MAG: XrtV sorting system accessory protein [Pseudomonadota bacterium]
MTPFDIYSMALFIASASIFFLRLRHEDPPLFPYLLISVTCAAANWLGNHRFDLIAIGVLAAAAFLLLHLTSQPYGPDPVQDGDADG